MNTDFIHLAVHSEYSMCEGIVRIKPLLEKAKEHCFMAIALTDVMNLFAVVKFYKAALANRVKPILGAEVWLENPKKKALPYKMTLLCKDNQGYLNLTKLISKGYQHGERLNGIPYLKRSWLSDFSEGLIALSGTQTGEIGSLLMANREKEAEVAATFYARVFSDSFYLQIERLNQENEESYIDKTIKLASTLSLPLIASNTVCFIQKIDYEAHLARVCIAGGQTLEEGAKNASHSSEQYLKSQDDMSSLFSAYPSALKNTVEVAKRCNVFLQFDKTYLPDFPIPPGKTPEKYLEHIAFNGLKERFKHILTDGLSVTGLNQEVYEKRLQVELDVINNMGFPGYFLIVADFIQWSKEHGIPVGPGRGSGAGSLVAYALKITDLDPLQYELLFERFLNPERVSMPDFDVDFCMDGRDRVIEYVAEKYGRESVSQIITFGRMAAKAVVRDVGRILGHPYGFVDRIAKLIPFELGITLKKALEDSEELNHLYKEDQDVKSLIDLGLKLEGIIRNAGKHAGGVVISPSMLSDFSAVFCEEGKSQIVSQFDKDDIESVGLVKFDFLGLRTLTIIDWALKNVQSQCGENIDISLIPTDDRDSFELLKKCLTTAVFQLESRGMKELISRLQPDCFEEIIALVALFRPGPLQSGMVDDFIDRKHGRAEVVYPHPKLEPILKPTYGVILYQEQVMQIAQVLAGFTLGAADLLRRAMGKKKPEEMARQREIFVSGAVERKVDKELANSIFDLMEKFAGYGFNKSHSAAYALVAYQTAWLKAHYKEAFMAAVLSSDLDNTDKVVIFLEECKALGINVRLPSINEGHYKFGVMKSGEIIYGLGAIKGLGEGIIEDIVCEREQNGPYQDLFELCFRVSAKKLNKRSLEALIKSGACDVLSGNRASMFEAITEALKGAQQSFKSQEMGQINLFSGEESISHEMALLPEWGLIEKLRYEKECIGHYFSDHPINTYKDDRAYISKTPLKKLSLSQKSAVIMGLVSGVRRIQTKRGKTFFIVTLEDEGDKKEALVFEKVFIQHETLFKKDNIIVVEAEVSLDKFNGGVRLVLNTAYSVSEARERYAKSLNISIKSEEVSNFSQVLALLKEHAGSTPVLFKYLNKGASVLVKAGSQYKVTPSDELINQLERLFRQGIKEKNNKRNVEVEY